MNSIGREEIPDVMATAFRHLLSQDRERPGGLVEKILGRVKDEPVWMVGPCGRELRVNRCRFLE